MSESLPQVHDLKCLLEIDLNNLKICTEVDLKILQNDLKCIEVDFESLKIGIDYIQSSVWQIFQERPQQPRMLINSILSEVI